MSEGERSGGPRRDRGEPQRPSEADIQRESEFLKGYRTKGNLGMYLRRKLDVSSYAQGRIDEDRTPGWSDEDYQKLLTRLEAAEQEGAK